MSTPYAIFASLFLYVGELFGIMNLLLYFLQVWDVSEPPPQPVLEGRTVDVLVPTYNEDVSLLRATLEACVRMDYPHKTYVLDDGRTDQGPGRPEVEALANELGVIYITRNTNLHAKAGNLNNALEQTDGEFVIVLDADHVPEPHFITRLIGYFHDDGLAYVQTPHAFYNFDSFQARLDHGNRKYWEEGDLFYRVIQPGRNHWNAAIFAGSAAMFRRTALHEVGYIATETVTEDMHTGLRLHEKGWRSLAISERLIAGQAPPDIATFHKQRQRWAEGNLGIMKFDNPLTSAGLTGAQRLCYFGSMIHWASGLFKLAIYLTPIMMLFSGVPPVREFTWNLAIVILTYLFISLYAMKSVSNGYGSIINSELFAMVNFWTQIKGTIGAILYRRTEFGVTQKSRSVNRTQRKNMSVWPYVRPQTYLIIVSILALFWGWMKLKLELNPIRFLSAHWPWLANQVNGTAWNGTIPAGFGISDDYFKPVVPTIWVLFFFWLAYKVTQRAFWPADRRLATRHVVHLPVEYEVAVEQGTIIQFGVTVDLNDTGMAFIAYEEIPRGAVLRCTLRGGGEIVKFKGEIKSGQRILRAGGADGFRYGVQFQNLTPPQVDAINRICLHYAVPKMFEEYARGNRNTFWSRVKSWQGRSFAQRRVARRNSYNMPIIINSGSTEETTQYSTTVDISRVATAAILENELPIGTQVGYLMPTPMGEVRGTAEVIRSEPQEVAGRLYYRTVMEFRDFESQGRTTLQTLVNTSERGGMGEVLRPDKRSLLPNMRIPILFVVGIAIPLIIFQTYLFPIFNREDYTLRRIHELGRRGTAKPMTAEQVADFDKIHEDTMARSYPSNDRLVNEMDVLIDNYPETPQAVDEKRRRMIDDVAIKLAPRAPDEPKLQKTLLYSYHHNRHWEDAERVFRDIEALRGKNRVTDNDWYEARLEAARVDVDAGKDKEASQLYDGLIKDAPGDLSLRNEYAGVLVRFGRFDEAEKVYEGVNPDLTARKLMFDINLQKMSQYPESEDSKIADAATRAMRVQKRKAAFDEALRQLTAIRFTPDLTPEQKLETDKMEANLYASTNNFEEAQKVLDRIRAAHPDETDVIAKVAQMQLGLNKYNEALKTSEMLLKDNVYTPNSIRAFIDSASAIKTLDAKNMESTDGPLDPTERQYATTIVENHLDKLTDDPLYLTRLSWVLIRCNNKAASVKVINDAYSAFQKNPGAQTDELRRQIAGLMIRQDDFNGAARVLSRANNFEARKLGNDLRLREKNFAEALRDAREMERIFTSKDEKLEIQKRIANIYVAKGDFNDAMKAYENLRSQDKDADIRIAQLYLYKAIPPGQPGYDPKLYPKQLEKALDELDRVLEKADDFRKVSEECGKDFIDAAAGAPVITSKQAAMAERLADEVLKTRGGDAEAMSRLAWVLLKTQDKEKANLVLDRATLLVPEDPKVRKELSGVLAQAGRNAEAANLVKNLASTDEEHLALAKLYSGARAWSDALLEVDAVLAKSPNNKDAEVLHADIQSWKGDHTEAIKEFDLLTKKYADDPKLPVRLAEVTLWKQDYIQALDQFLVVYETQPNNPQVWSGIAATIAAIAGLGDGKVPVRAVNAIQSIANRVAAGTSTDTLLLARMGLVMAFLKNPIATELVDRALKTNPQDPIVRIELASALSALKRYSEAVQLYKGLQLTAQNRIQLINIASAAEQLDLAADQARLLVIEAAKEADEHKNDKVYLQKYLISKRFLAQVLSWRGDYNESMTIYQELINVGFDQSDIKLKMAEVEVWAHQYVEGLIRFNDLVDTKLEQPRVWIGFINAASSTPNMTKAQEKNILFINEKVAGEIKEPELLSRLAWTLIRQQYAAKADPLLKRAVEMLKKDPRDAAIRKEVAGVLEARLFPNQVIIPEPGQELVTRRWLIREAIALFSSLDPLTELDQKTRIEFITVLLVSDERDNLAKAEALMIPLREKTPRESYELRIRYGEVLLYSAKYDLSRAKFREAQEQFGQLIKDIKDPTNPWYQLAEVRLAQSYLWGKEPDTALPIFKRVLKDYVITDKNRNIVRDTWLGFIDSLSASIGEKFRSVKSEEDVDRVRANLLSNEEREGILWCYQRAGKFQPDPSMKLSDPEQYEKEIEYYTGSLARLGIELAYMGEMQKSQEIYQQAIRLNTDQRKIDQLWGEYAAVLQHLRAYQQAELIYRRLPAVRGSR